MYSLVQHTINQCQRHAKTIYMTIGIVMLAIIISYSYQSYQVTQHNRVADAFFELTGKSKQPSIDDLTAFAQKHEGTIFSDLCRLKLAATHYHSGSNPSLVIQNLERIITTSPRNNMQSLAAYRLANFIKHTDPTKALELTQKIQIKSLRHLRALLRAELYRKENDQAKALLEINSLLSDIEIDNESDSKLVIELATQEKRQIINEQKQT